eukprot:2394149-Alexandrium_andersonii.AAC.1
MIERAAELLRLDKDHPVYYVQLKHQKREEAQREIREALTTGGVAEGLSVIRMRRGRSSGPGAAMKAAAPVAKA